jgi:hypothetical protein
MTITESKFLGSSPPANGEPDIPVAFASVLLVDENPPPTAPGYAAISTTAYQVPAIPTTATTTAIVSASKTEGALVVKPSAPNFGERPIPPNAPPGGQWVLTRISPIAFIGRFCPEQAVYMSPKGVMYNERGEAVGDRRRHKYKVINKAL